MKQKSIKELRTKLLRMFEEHLPSIEDIIKFDKILQAIEKSVNKKNK